MPLGTVANIPVATVINTAAGWLAITGVYTMAVAIVSVVVGVPTVASFPILLQAFLLRLSPITVDGWLAMTGIYTMAFTSDSLVVGVSAVASCPILLQAYLWSLASILLLASLL